MHCKSAIRTGFPTLLREMIAEANDALSIDFSNVVSRVFIPASENLVQVANSRISNK